MIDIIISIETIKGRPRYQEWVHLERVRQMKEELKRKEGLYNRVS